jgi:trk system potassium uptake protein TrkA
MKILILGAGRVGESVAESLVSEKNDITVIDTDPQRLRELQDRLDLRGVVGQRHPALGAARRRHRGRRHADRLRAAGRDQPRGLQGGARRLQRAHHHRPHAQPRVPNDGPLLGKEGFAVDQVICPEQSVTAYIRKLIEYPEALQVLEFATAW